MVRIDYVNGFQTRYLHLSYGTVNVNVGDKVIKRYILGNMIMKKILGKMDMLVYLE